MEFGDDERDWFPNLAGEMDEWPSDSEMDEDTLDNMYDAHMDALLYGDMEFEENAYEMEQERRQRTALARWKMLRRAIKVNAIPNTFEEWLRLAYDQALFKDGGRGALAAKEHFYACAALQNA